MMTLSFVVSFVLLVATSYGVLIPHHSVYVSNLERKELELSSHFKEQLYELIEHAIHEGFDRFFVPWPQSLLIKAGRDYSTAVWYHTKQEALAIDAWAEVQAKMKEFGYYLNCESRGFGWCLLLPITKEGAYDHCLCRKAEYEQWRNTRSMWICNQPEVQTDREGKRLECPRLDAR